MPSTKKTPCPLCQRDFYRKDHYKHRRSKHVQCDECHGYKVYVGHNWLGHARNFGHSGTRLLELSSPIRPGQNSESNCRRGCGRAITVANLSRHENKRHEKCGYCDKVFIGSEIDTHIRKTSHNSWKVKIVGSPSEAPDKEIASINGSLGDQTREVQTTLDLQNSLAEPPRPPPDQSSEIAGNQRTPDQIPEVQQTTPGHQDSPPRLILTEGFSNNPLKERLISRLHVAKNIIVVAGAGISTSANIPDFRSNSGFFERYGRDVFDASVLDRADSREEHYVAMHQMAKMCHAASPTPFHRLLAKIADEGRLLRLYTQNVDCLEERFEALKTAVPLGQDPESWPVTIRLHGSLDCALCTACKTIQRFGLDHPAPWPCGNCQRAMRPAVLLYNETSWDSRALVKVLEADAASEPDLVIYIGTSLHIESCNRFAKAVRKNSPLAYMVYIDRDPAACLDDCWDLVVQAECDRIAELYGKRRAARPAKPTRRNPSRVVKR